jgi:hypothetical protein
LPLLVDVKFEDAVHSRSRIRFAASMASAPIGIWLMFATQQASTTFSAREAASVLVSPSSAGTSTSTSGAVLGTSHRNTGMVDMTEVKVYRRARTADLAFGELLSYGPDRELDYRKATAAPEATRRDETRHRWGGAFAE